ncbi:MAG: hypothetical protein ACOYIS_01835 [Candidatus Cloacimonadaceae bacterium]|jgi:hypothetical protein
MHKSLWLCCLLLIASINMLSGLSSGPSLPEASRMIVQHIDTGEPIFLEIRAGQHSNTLANEVKKKLLDKGADLREAELGDFEPAQDSTSEHSISQARALSQLGLAQARLVLVEMELDWKTVEERGFLSYSSTRIPLYHFNIKQIALPSGQLLQLDSFTQEAKTSPDTQKATKGITWFEPMLITAALASIIYLLWTTQ